MLRNHLKRLLLLTPFMLFISSCGLVQPHKQDIVQGNDLPDLPIDRIEVGMRKEQVHYLLGAPVLHRPASDHTWQYLYTIETAEEPRVQSQVSIHFDAEGRVTHIN